MAGAPKGNQNASRGKFWRAAIERALERRTKSRGDGLKEIDALAERLIQLVAAGDISAIKEFGDRIDGKAHQSMDIGVTGSRTAEELGDDELASIAAAGRAGTDSEAAGPNKPTDIH